MLQQIRLFFTAVQFFTRLPVSAWVGHSAEQLNQSSRYFPAVGFIVGGMTAAVWWSAAQILPLDIALLLSMATSLLITGGFHEDGLSDFVDGFGGGYQKEEILKIMKDSHVGPYGVIAIVFVLLIKFASLQHLTMYSFNVALVTLVVAHVMSRLLAASLMYTQRYVREDESSRAKPAAQGMSNISFAITLLFGASSLGLLLCTGVSLWTLCSALIAALLMRVYLALHLYKTLGGYTGDCLGAVQQLTEISFYLGLIAALPK